MPLDPDLYHRCRPFTPADLFMKSTIKEAISMMHLNKNKQENIVEIGCGPGNFTRDDILLRFPEPRKMIAFDLQLDMIEFSKSHYDHPDIEYTVADIRDWSTLKQWEGTATKLFSIMCLHYPKDQKLAFTNSFRLMATGGQAAFLFILQDSVWDSLGHVAGSEKWTRYLHNISPCIPDSHFKGYSATHYEHMFQDIGFEVVVCKEIPNEFLIDDHDSFKEWLMSVCALYPHVPEPLRNDFKEEVYRAYIAKHPIRPDGRIQLYIKSLFAFVNEPNKR